MEAKFGDNPFGFINHARKSCYIQGYGGFENNLKRFHWCIKDSANHAFYAK